MINKQSSQQSVWLTLTVILMGLMMRSPITTIPLMLHQIAATLHVSLAHLAILTTIPLVMFLLISNWAAKTMAVLGLKRALTYAVSVIVIGSLLRCLPFMTTMLVGTVLIGMGVAYLNVLMPALITAYFPLQVGTYTSLYTVMIMLGVAFFNILTAPVVDHFSWQVMMVVLVVIPIFTLVCWLLARRRAHTVSLPVRSGYKDKELTQAVRRLWTNPRAWALLMTFGGQSVINYVSVAWMPALMTVHLVPPVTIGWLMALYSLIGMPTSLFLPNLVVRLSAKWLNLLILISTGLGLLVAGMLCFQLDGTPQYWAAILLIMGYVTSFFFIFTMTMFVKKTQTAAQTAAVSGMAQAGGYLMAALGPIWYGHAFAKSPAGLGQNIAFMVVVLAMGWAAWYSNRTSDIFSVSKV